MSGEDINDDADGADNIWSQQHVGARNTWAFSSSSDHDHQLADCISISDLTFSKLTSSLRRKSTSNLKNNNVNKTTLPPKSNLSILRKTKHIDIKQWLISMELLKYEETLNQFGGVEELIDFSEADLRSLGIKRSSDRALMISNLTMLRSKYYGEEFMRKPSVRHSIAYSSGHHKRKEERTSVNETTTYEQVQSKSLGDLIMDTTVDPSLITQELRKELEWELSLDSRDLRSHAWYHGAIPRSRAEDIVREEGGFLVRDCTSQPGNYVLTCRTKNTILHFVIKKLVFQRDTVYEKIQYQFEEDAFDTVADLITYYVGSERSITAASAAKIQFPKNRMYPLSYYAGKYPTPRLTTSAMSNSSSPTRSLRDGPPRLPSKKQRSHSLTPSEVNRISQEKCNSADGVIQSPLMTRSAGAATFSTHSLPRNSHAKLSLSSSSSTLGRNTRLQHSDSSTALSPCEEQRQFFSADAGYAEPPPKPSRVPTIIPKDSSLDFIPHGGLQRVTSYHASGSDSGNGSGDSALSSAAGDAAELSQMRNCGVIIKNPRYMVSSESSTTLKNYEYDLLEAEEKLLHVVQPELEHELCSRFDLEMFHTLLLPIGENKPLDNEALTTIKNILRETGSRILANHLTRTDLDIVFYKAKNSNVEAKLVNGIELSALPHGHQFRLDLLERTECLKMLVAVTILSCTYEKERTEMLSKWIEIAVETKTALGNLYGFCGIMLGLCSPKVLELDSTWHLLRRQYTDSALNFEAKLRPTLKNMNTCSNPQAPNTTIPHLLPLIIILERSLEDFLAISESGHSSGGYIGTWESNTQDYGLTTLLNHLETARKYMASSASYQRNAEIVLGEARLDELTVDMFRTEFQIKFLWGSRGALIPSYDRHSKLEEILAVLATRCKATEQDAEV